MRWLARLPLEFGSWRAEAHVVAAVLCAVVIPGGSFVMGSGVFSWNMFSKSSTYQLNIVGVAKDGSSYDVDARELGPYVGPALRSFLPPRDTWFHGPVGVTFRTGLNEIARLSCRAAPVAGTTVTLKERKDLDAVPRVTVAHADCP